VVAISGDIIEIFWRMPSVLSKYNSVYFKERLYIMDNGYPETPRIYLKFNNFSVNTDNFMNLTNSSGYIYEKTEWDGGTQDMSINKIYSNSTIITLNQQKNIDGDFWNTKEGWIFGNNLTYKQLEGQGGTINLNTNDDEFLNAGEFIFSINDYQPEVRTWYVDYIQMRTYAEPEPTYSISSEESLIHTPIKQKILFITDTNWKNVLSITPVKKPTIITNTIDNDILHFINNYNPEQIFLLGNITGEIPNFEIHKISYVDIPQLFFNTSKGVYAGEDKQKATLASLFASILNISMVFSPNDALPEYNFTNNSTEEIENLYLQKVKEQNKNINYLVLTDGNTSLGAIIASQKTGFIIQTNSTDSNEILHSINETIKKLNLYGFYINNPSYILDGAYLLVLGNITPITKDDPVEKGKFLGLWTFSDNLDGKNFTTYLEYGDLNNDTYLDLAIGRLPNDDKIASLMFARTFLEDNKKALVASEYLHTNWFTILLYFGGGMWQGRTVSHILEDQGYDVTRLVEHRSDPLEFLASLAPVNIKDFLNQADTIGEKVGKILGSSIGSVVSKVLMVLKGLQFVEQGLEMYLEYDWSTFGPKLENALEYLDNLAQNQNITQEHAMQLIYILWPYPWLNLDETNLIQHIPDSSIIYYEGMGNGTDWILPNVFPEDTGFLGWKEFLNNYQYNGSKTLHYTSIPNLNSRLVWDNSDLAAKGLMMQSFLEKGTASFVGASAINYVPFSSEIDTRFFKSGRTIGTALTDAINEFRDDWFVWDPFSIIRPGIKAKTLREFTLFGDPALKKDPITTKPNFTKSISCNSECELSISIPVSYSLISTNNETTILVDTENHLLEISQPVIPLIEFEYFLPFTGSIIGLPVITSSDKIFYNISLPKLDLLSHSLSNLTNITDSAKYYPDETYRLLINSTIDNRTRIKLIHAAIQYNESNKTAKVFDTINISIKYTSPLEFSISTQDVPFGQNTTINVTIWNTSEMNTTLYLQISNSTHSSKIISNLILSGKENNFSFSYKPENLGNFLVEGVLESEDIRVGPRESVFSVLDVIPPKWSNVRKSPSNINFSSDKITIDVEWEDNVGIDEVLIFYKFNESFENSTYLSKRMGYIGNNIYQVNLSFDWSELAGKTFWFYLFANDTSGNVNTTSEFSDYIEGLIKPASYYLFAFDGDNIKLSLLPNFTSKSNILTGKISGKMKNGNINFEGNEILNMLGYIRVEKKICFLKWCRKIFQYQPITAQVNFNINQCVYFTNDKIYCSGPGKIKIVNQVTKSRQEYALDKVRIKIYGKSGSVEGFKNFENVFNVTGMRAIKIETRR
jgi:hypothetical protein